MTLKPRMAFGVCVVAGMLISTAAHAQLPQMPDIGTIDFFGLEMPESEAIPMMPFKVGDDGEGAAMAMALADPDNIAALLGAKRGTAAFVCCNADGLTIAFIGLTDSDEPAVAYRDPPTEEAFLPEDMVGRYERSMVYVFEQAANPQGPDDMTQGHALSRYLPMREVQESFVADARDNQALLVRVLRMSVDPQHRIVAAQILGYAPDKRAIVPELVLAVRDSDGTVRNNATRALGVIASYAVANPELGIDINADVFVDMLSSVVWTDRNKGLMVLEPLSRSRDAQLLATLRTRAFSALIDMCAWKNLGHAEPACRILERVLGLPEQETLHPREWTLAEARALDD